MRRGDLIIKIASFIAFLAVAVYIGYYLYDARMNPLRTVAAVELSAYESVEAKGYAVREERLITGGGAGSYVTAADGEKLHTGGAVAVKYSSGAAVERSEQMKEAQLRLEALSVLLGGKTVADVASETVMELAYTVRGGGISGLSAAAAKAETYIFADEITYSTESVKAEIASLEGQLDAYAAASAGDTETISSPASGVFSTETDGFEGVSPDALEGLTRDGFAELFKTPSDLPSDTVGKLVTGLRWYFVTTLPSEDANRLGTSATVSFSRTYSKTVKMRVEYIGDNEDGIRTVVLSSGQYMHELAQVRKLYGEIIYSSETGLRAPREALHIDDAGQTYVYVRVGVVAQRADVTILSESEDYYIVRPTVDPKTGSRLAAGTEIIISSGELFDGKVIG